MLDLDKIDGLYYATQEAYKLWGEEPTAEGYSQYLVLHEQLMSALYDGFPALRDAYTCLADIPS